VSACVGPQVSATAPAEAEVYAWACHLSDLAHRRYENARKMCQKKNDLTAWMKALKSATVFGTCRGDSLAASVQSTALNVPLLPPPLLGLKTVLGGQILAERESK
jgi:hypothetical protein